MSEKQQEGTLLNSVIIILKEILERRGISCNGLYLLAAQALLEWDGLSESDKSILEEKLNKFYYQYYLNLEHENIDDE